MVPCNFSLTYSDDSRPRAIFVAKCICTKCGKVRRFLKKLAIGLGRVKRVEVGLRGIVIDKQTSGRSGYIQGEAET